MKMKEIEPRGRGAHLSSANDLQFTLIFSDKYGIIP